MTPIDYENLFIYMSLIFAICIFITLLYACVFAGGSKIEKFRGDEDNMKDQILHLLNDLKSKDTTTEDDKANLDVIIQTFSSSNVNVNDLVSIIKQLKKFAPASPASPALRENRIKQIAEDTPTPIAMPDAPVNNEPKKDSVALQEQKEQPTPTPLRRIPIDNTEQPAKPTEPTMPTPLTKIRPVA
jgi:hypothetical protein